MTKEELEKDATVVETIIAIGFNEAGEVRLNSALHPERVANILKQMHDSVSRLVTYRKPKKVVGAAGLPDVFDPNALSGNGRHH